MTLKVIVVAGMSGKQLRQLRERAETLWDVPARRTEADLAFLTLAGFLPRDTRAPADRGELPASVSLPLGIAGWHST